MVKKEGKEGADNVEIFDAGWNPTGKMKHLDSITSQLTKTMLLQALSP